MKTSEELKRNLYSIDQKGYKAYKSLEGTYSFKDYVLAIDHVQGDPFASPSRVRVIINNNLANFPKNMYDTYYKKVALTDFLTRLFDYNIYKFTSRVSGSGKSGLIFISKCPQEILDRTAIVINNDSFEVRFEVGFPARGRSVLARELEKILYDFLPNIVDNTLKYENINKKKLIDRIKLVEDQEYIRKEIENRNLVAFIANGSILPRERGVSTKPLKDSVKFISPKSLEVTLNLPNRGEIKGMGIPKGITLIVGGGYHGKSTFLRALELGVYNHIEGDGREFVITENSAVKVRAEDGRVIHKDDISLFISNLPNKKNTKKFDSENASGSTSQAANIIEAIEGKASTLLIDEDTSATNFMVRDDVMQQLVSKEKEPITPFIEIVRGLYEQKGISTIIVVGSSGDYFDIADTVVQMDSYVVEDVTEKAKGLAMGKIAKRIKDMDIKIDIDYQRKLKKGSIEKSPKGVKIKTLGIDGLSINKEDINLRAVEQIVDKEQVTAIGYIIKWLEENKVNGELTIEQLVQEAQNYIDKNGLISICQLGNLAMPRRHEILAGINRNRKLKL